MKKFIFLICLVLPLLVYGATEKEIVDFVNSNEATETILYKNVGLTTTQSKNVFAGKPYKTIIQIKAVRYMSNLGITKLNAYVDYSKVVIIPEPKTEAKITYIKNYKGQVVGVIKSK